MVLSIPDWSAFVVQSKISWAVMGSIASIAVARGAQVWSRAQLTRQQMQDAMVDSLYNKAADSQEGVLHTVLDEMCDQHTREMIIAYAVLLMRSEQPFATDLSPY